MLNATPLLEKFLDVIDLTRIQREKLTTADTIIRDWLRKSFHEARNEVRNNNGKSVSIMPRFRRQGSYVYKTINQPAWPPKQQIDLDDGTYLPMSIVRDIGPQVASNLFFEFVDRQLGVLASRKGWKLDSSKDTCVRLVLDDTSHIDVPLYAIPDEEFRVLEARMAAARIGIAAFSTEDGLVISPDRVFLAHRKKGWVPSDPRKFHVWFTREVSNHTDQIRRMCRLFKAWRDHHKDLDGLTSVAIMVAVANVYNNPDLKGFRPRDDHALLTLTDALPPIFSGKIFNPAEPQEDLTVRIPAPVMHRAANRMWDFHQSLSNVLAGQNADAVVSCLQQHLGKRVPNNPKLISNDSPRVEIMRHPEKVVAAPAVISSKSG